MELKKIIEEYKTKEQKLSEELARCEYVKNRLSMRTIMQMLLGYI